MQYGEFDEQAAMEFMQMLKEGPTIKDIIDTYPGVDNWVHVMTAQVVTHFVLPFLEDKMSVPDLVEAVRRYLFAGIATGLNLGGSDEATNFVMHLYNRPAGEEGQDNCS